jgi:hypothetical protein
VSNLGLEKDVQPSKCRPRDGRSRILRRSDLAP